jgi:hypothetical protein
MRILLSHFQQSKQSSPNRNKTKKSILLYALTALLLPVAPAQLFAQSVPVIGSAATATSKVGNAFSYQITASNAPTLYSAGSLPSGLTVNKTIGLISGTIIGIDGNYSVNLYAVNAVGTGSKKLALTVAPTLPVITATAIPIARTSTAFSFKIPATNHPRTYGATGLPAGFSLNATTGLITGSSAVISNSTVSLSATNGAGTATKILNFKCLPKAPVITSNATASGKVQTAFSYQITTLNTPTSYNATGLPAGLSLNTSTGLINGQPTGIDGFYNATLTATNAGGMARKSLAITVAPTLPVITSNESAVTVVNQKFSYRLTAAYYPRSTGATNLPTGLTYNATTRLISGTPTATGNRTVTLTATNGAGTATKTLLLQVTPSAPLITTNSVPTGILGQAYSNTTFNALRGVGNRTWSLVEGFVPNGMTFNATTGTLSGTPLQAGVHNFVIRSTDTMRQFDELEVVLGITDPATGTVAADIFSIFPSNGAPQHAGNATCSFNYQPSGSTWTAGINEASVFLASINMDRLRLGIGKGGQIYSLRGSFGESIPPQRTAAPWVDEAWQFVATNVGLVGPIQNYQDISPENRASGFPMQFFIHQSGIYLAGLAGNNATGASSTPFYSPTLKSSWNPSTRTFQTVSWSQMARSPNVWKSGLLTYTSFRDLGSGAIEVTNVVTNFGNVELTFVNTPWGGTRQSSLPSIAVSKSTGGWQEYRGAFNSLAPLAVRNTAGWMATSLNPYSTTSHSLGFVFGPDLPSGPLPHWKVWRPVLRFGSAGDITNRNYQVAVVANQVRLRKGQTLACRWHLVGGQFSLVSSRSASLAPFAGMWQPQTDATKLVPVWIFSGAPSSTGTGHPQLHLYAQPIPGTMPVFAMEDTRDGRIFATHDPYTLCPTAPFTNPLPPAHASYATYQNRLLHYQYESPGQLRELLGYAFPTQPPVGNDENVTLPGVAGPLSLWAPQLP